MSETDHPPDPPPQKLRLLSVEAIKAIYERELTREGLDLADAPCDEEALRQIVEAIEQALPPGTPFEYVTGDEIRQDQAKEDAPDGDA